MAEKRDAGLARVRLDAPLPPLENRWKLPGNLSLVEPACQLLVSGGPDDPAFRAAVEGVLGVALPGPGGHSGRMNYAVWQAPGRWLLVGDEEADFGERLRAATAGLACLVSDVTDGLAVFEIEGPWARALLSQGTGLDLTPGALGPGEGAATLFAGLPVTLYPVGTPDRFRMHGERASVRYLWDWLRTAASAYLEREEP